MFEFNNINAGNILVIQEVELVDELSLIVKKIIASATKSLYGTPYNESLENIHNYYKNEEIKKILLEVRNHQDISIKIPALLSKYIYDSIGNWNFLIEYREHLRIIPPSDFAHASETIAVGYHRDTWLGFPSNVINIWIPFTDTTDANLLLKPQYYSVKYGKKPLDGEVDEYFRPNIPFGSILLFGGHHIHGSSQNNTPFSRVSIDYRVVPIAMQSLTYRLNEFMFSPLLGDQSINLVENRKETRRVIKKFFQYWWLTSYIFDDETSHNILYKTIRSIMIKLMHLIIYRKEV